MKKSELKQLIREAIEEVGGSSVSREDVLVYLVYMIRENPRLDEKTRDAFKDTLRVMLQDMAYEVSRARRLDHIEVSKYLSKLANRHSGPDMERIIRTSNVVKDMADPESRNRPFDPGTKLIG